MVWFGADFITIVGCHDVIACNECIESCLAIGSFRICCIKYNVFSVHQIKMWGLSPDDCVVFPTLSVVLPLGLRNPGLFGGL